MASDFERTMYWLVKRRRDKTLVTWLHDLNCWRWPKLIPEPESPDVADHPRRQIAIDAILRELGWRYSRLVRQWNGM